MPSDSAAPLPSRLAAGGSLGAALGFLHALVETALLGWYGAPTGVGDVALEAALLACGGLLGGLVVGAIATRGGVRRQVFAAVAAVYSLAFVWIVFSRSDGWTWLGWVTLVLAAAGLITTRVLARDAAPAAATSGFLTLAVLACTLQLFDAQTSAIPDAKHGAFLAWAAAFVLAAGGAFLAASSRRTPAWLPLAASTALAAVLWATVLPGPTRWTVHESDATVIGADAGGRPNVLLIVLDTLRADHLELFGYRRETMPQLANLARREFDLITAVSSTSNWTLPSHASMFTGLYPATHGAHRPFHNQPDPPPLMGLRSDVPTLAEYLDELGYETAAIVANPIVGSYGLERGFRRHDATVGARAMADSTAWLFQFQIASRPPGNLIRELLPKALARKTRWFDLYSPQMRRAAEIEAETERWLDARAPRPFFLFLNFFDVHDPYLPVPEDDERFMARPESVDWLGFPFDEYDRYLQGEGEIPDEHLRFLEAQYDAEALGIDRALAALFEDLKRRGLYDDTLIVVTSDHGEAFLEHGFLRHEGSLHEEQIAVPLLIKLPEGQAAPSLADPTLLQPVDYFPTIAALVGGAAPAGVEGEVWGGSRAYARVEAFCFVCNPRSGLSHVERLHEDLAAIRFGTIKTSWSTRSAQAETFDLSLDPGETVDLAPQYPAEIERAKALLDARKLHIPDTVTESLEPDALETLRQLGYIQ